MLLAVALVVILLAPTAHAAASGTVPAVPADSDGSCDTAPVSYPADGEPVPGQAGCTLVLGPDDAVVGEVWSWRDESSVHWYTYPAASAAEITVGSVLMCGRTDPSAAGVVYECSADSAYLLFAVSSVFVEWPAPPTGPLHYCQAVRFEGGQSAVTGTACASVARAVADTPMPTPTPTPSPLDNLATPAPPPPAPVPQPTVSAEPPPSPVATGAASPTSAINPPAPTAPVSSTPPPADTAAPPSPPTPTAQDPTVQAGSDAGAEPNVPPVGQDLDPAAGSTPLESASVAVVGGARFPLGFVIALALALAVGGIVMLSGPGFAAARRRRR